jgi:hypothetical protein|tara:strand:+ start:398 stop:565 length:168 start_codon:yes stop_codon:yes gene_type:complete
MTYEEACDKVTDYIMDMDSRDRWNEIHWLVQQYYQEHEYINLLNDYSFNKEGEIE